MAYFVDDEEGVREYTFLAEALDDAAECIKEARKNCDPEWPTSVQSIRVFEAPSGCECLDEDGKLLYIATETNVQTADDGDGCEYWCDYEMRAPAPAAQEGGVKK